MARYLTRSPETVLGRIWLMHSCEKLSLLMLIPAVVLYTLAVFTNMWFELPGVHYGIFWAYFCKLDVCHIIPAFFTDEPWFYHLLQLLSLFAWYCLGLAVYMLFSNKMDLHIPRCLKKNRHTAIALVCFAAVFTMNFGLYLFYYILQDFPSETDSPPALRWAGVLVAVSCVCELMAGLFLLQM